MTRRTKITIISLSVVLIVILILSGGLSAMFSRVALREVNSALASIPECEASIGDIRISLLTGTATIDDLRFTHNGPAIKGSAHNPGVEVHVEHIEVGHVFFYKLIHKEALVYSIRVIHPEMELWLDEAHPELSFPEFKQDSTVKNPIAPLKCAELMNLYIDGADMKMHSTRTSLDLEVEDCSLSLCDLAYDTAFHYCDSLYSIALNRASILLPDSSMRIETNDLSNMDGGPLRIGKTLIAHTMGRTQLGEMVQEPTTWIKMRMDSLKTSSFPLIRKALTQDYTLPRVEVFFEHMDILRDLRYPAKEPFPMVQEAFMSINPIFLVQEADVHIPKINIGLMSTDINCGTLQIRHIRAKAMNITNRRNAIMRLKGSCPIEKGKMHIEMNFTINKNCDFETRIHAQNVNASFLNTLVRPLVGMTCDLPIDTFDTHYSGNKTEAAGQFRLLYHGLEVKVHKEDNIPYKIVTRNADVINSAVHTLLPKSNPSTAHSQPRAYNTQWKRNVWMPTELYLFGPCIDGVKKTLLPGLYIKDKTKVLDL